VNRPPHPQRLRGRVASSAVVSASMRELTLVLEGRLDFLPGQFCMLNLGDAREMVLSRPFSILHAEGPRLTLLLKVVGEGTRRLVDAAPGAPLTCLGPLGRSFPPPRAGLPALLLAGGVGLPPLLAWRRRWGGEADLALFGGRDGGDVPWDLLAGGWRCSVDRHADMPAGRDAFTGTVVDLARSILDDDAPRRVLACGPLPLLRAAAGLARERGWECLVSVEERMGCGYGVCRGCVVPRADGDGWATACQDGPVFDAADVDWDGFGHGADAAGCARAAGGDRT
jgi:dihydroorotate dehydrogenase electron transfer subunit